jgi:hypothetical protein
MGHRARFRMLGSGNVNEYSIEHASHRLCAALHMVNVDPADIEISLPYDAWWRLWTILESRHRGLMNFDGRGIKPGAFQYMGVTYSAKSERTP